MRTKIMLLAAMALAPVAIAADAQVKKPAVALILRSQGLSIVGKTPVPIRATFDMSRATAIAVVSQMRGAPIKSGTIEDCGSGTPMDYANFKGGLQLNFIGGKFVGWYLGPVGDRSLKTVKGIGLGSTRAAFKAAYPAATVEEGSLGIEYASDDAGSGIFSSAKPTAIIETMWAGQTCIAR